MERLLMLWADLVCFVRGHNWFVSDHPWLHGPTTYICMRCAVIKKQRKTDGN